MLDKLRMTVLVTTAVLMIRSVSVGAEVPDDAVSVRFRLLRDCLIVVSVELETGIVSDFVLDTGTNSTIIIPELATRLQVRAQDQQRMITPTGVRTTPRGWLSRLVLGDREVRGVEFLIDDLTELRKLDGRICGILGQNFLAHFNYLVDYRKQRIDFGNNTVVEGRGEKLGFKRDEGRLLVLGMTGQRKDGDTGVELVLDSAASTIVLFGAASELRTLAGVSAQLASNGGPGAVGLGVLRALRVGGERFNDIRVALVTEPCAAGERRERGLLPTSLFRSIYFNNQEGYVVLNPQLAH